MNILQKILVILLLTATFWLRFYKVDSLPSGLYHDEIDAGLQARSLIETGKDYRGTFSLFYINSFVDPRTPIPVWVTVLSTLLFNTPELEVRMGSVILGTLNVLLIFLLIKLWTNNLWKSVLTSFVFSTNPWQIQFSRFNHEAQSIQLFVLFSFLFLTKALNQKNKFFLFLFSVSLGLSMYTYRTMSLLAPLILFLCFFVFKKQLLAFGTKTILLTTLFFVVITAPFLYATTFAAKDTPRIAQISIFSDSTVPIQVQRDRELDSGDLNDFQFGKQPSKQSFIFHNKAVSAITQFSKNYFSTFSVDLLFLSGDKNKRHSIEGHGLLFYLDIIAIGSGLFFLVKNRKDRFNQIILGLFFISPIPSSLTQDGAAHGARIFAFSLPLLICIGFGYYQILTYLKQQRRSFILFSAFGSLWVVLFVFYLHQYFIHSYYSSARWHSFGYKQAISKIDSLKPEHIFLTSAKDPPIIFYLFWANIPPQEIQKYGSEFSLTTRKNTQLDKIKVSELPQNNIPELIKSLAFNSVYLVSQKELPKDLRTEKPPAGINLIDIITYPDKEVAFYIISKQTPNQHPTQN